jgi:hypothetical protein
MIDQPGLSLAKTEYGEVDLLFSGKIIDVCNGDKVIKEIVDQRVWGRVAHTKGWANAPFWQGMRQGQIDLP